MGLGWRGKGRQSELQLVAHCLSHRAVPKSMLTARRRQRAMQAARAGPWVILQAWDAVDSQQPHGLFEYVGAGQVPSMVQSIAKGSEM